MTSACEKQLVSALTVLTVLKKNGHRLCFVILIPKGTVSIGSRDRSISNSSKLFSISKTVSINPTGKHEVKGKEERS